MQDVKSVLNDKDAEVTDEIVESLLSGIDDNIKKAEQRVKGFSKEEYYRLRARCKRDLFFLAYGVLGYNRLSVDFHGEMCDDVINTEDVRFRCFLDPRGHFKSTILTIADSIRIILPYTEEDRQHDLDPRELPWPLTLGPDCRLLIGHETSNGAARFLLAITYHVTSNPLLMGLYPEIVPSARKQRINKYELELPRESFWPEPTIDTMGVGAKSQGKHYNFLKFDDLYGDKARDSEAEDQTTKDWIDNAQSFLSSFALDHIDFVGTRYKVNDAYDHIFERYGNQLFVHIRKVEEADPITGEVRAAFHEEFTPEILEIIKKNKKVYNAQYLNDPYDIETNFNKEWKQFFYWKALGTFVVFSGNEQTLVDVRDLDVCILIDPGIPYGGFVVTGMDALSRIFILSSLRLELSPTDFTEFVFKQASRWQPRVVSIEADLFAETYEHWWQREMIFRNQRFSIYPYKTRKKSQSTRIAGITQYFAARQVWANEAQDDFWWEYDHYGKVSEDDIHILDALSQGQEVWRPATSRRFQDANFKVEQQAMAGRDSLTGYSEI